jgi:hypothetical protein
MARRAIFKPHASPRRTDICHCFQDDEAQMDMLPKFAAKIELARS